MGSTTPVVPGAVTLAVGDNFQAAVDANPAGTAYTIASGTHRLQQVVAKDGDTFTGPADMSAIVSGAKILDPAAFTFDAANNRYYIGGQTQSGTSQGAAKTEPGFSRDYYNEEVFVNGDTRLRHAETLGGLVAGKFYFDYAASRIYLKDDPASFALIETSVTPFAFGGTAVSDVQISRVVVEKYASPWQYGAIGGDQTNRYTYDWIITDCVSRLNHGAGVILGPGGKLRYSTISRNGQLGVAGNGEHLGYAARLEMSNCELDYNRELGVSWGWEGGGTKFSNMSGDFFNNWIHHNYGPGLWSDISNYNSKYYSNLVNDNRQHGIFYEVSGDDPPLPPTQIFWNEVHDNSKEFGDKGGIDIANSRNVDVFENLVYNEPRGIQLRMNESRWEQTIGTHFGRTENVQVYGNDNQTTFKVMLFCTEFESQAEADEWAYNRGNGFHDNVHRVPNLPGNYFRWGAIDFSNLTAAQWQAIHPNETIIASTVKGTMPAGATPFDPAAVGPR